MKKLTLLMFTSVLLCTSLTSQAHGFAHYGGGHAWLLMVGVVYGGGYSATPELQGVWVA